MCWWKSNCHSSVIRSVAVFVLYSSLLAHSLASAVTTTTPPAKMPVRNVLVVIAMEAEAQPFVDHLQLQPISTSFFPSPAPFHAFRGNHGDCTVTLVTNGKDTVYETGVDQVGTIPAALATYLALQQLQGTVAATTTTTTQTVAPPELVINAGTCGGFRRKGAAIGDVYVTTAVAHHDRRIPIPEFTPYGVGKLDTTRRWGHPHYTPHELADQLGYKTGICTTGNSLDTTEEDSKHMLANDATVKDMEAAAIAWSCALFETPFMGIKVVTDIVDGDVPTMEEFLANLQAASKRLQEALPQVLDYVCQPPTDNKTEEL